MDIKQDNLWLMRGDCLERMKEIPDGSVDMVLTDPPYGTSALKSWDSVIPSSQMWEQLCRITKPEGAIVLFSSQPFTSLLITSNLSMYKYNWVWDKNRGANYLNFKYQPSKVHEDICVFGKMATSYSKNGNMQYYPQMVEGKPYTQKQGRASHSTTRDEKSRNFRATTVSDGRRYPKSIQSFTPETGLHPTQKPVTLMEYLIKTYTNKGETVLDFTMGSGTTGVACQNLSRSFIGIELDQNYYQVARDRILGGNK